MSFQTHKTCVHLWNTKPRKVIHMNWASLLIWWTVLIYALIHISALMNAHSTSLFRKLRIKYLWMHMDYFYKVFLTFLKLKYFWNGLSMEVQKFVFQRWTEVSWIRTTWGWEITVLIFRVTVPLMAGFLSSIQNETVKNLDSFNFPAEILPCFLLSCLLCCLINIFMHSFFFSWSGIIITYTHTTCQHLCCQWWTSWPTVRTSSWISSSLQ